MCNDTAGIIDITGCSKQQEQNFADCRIKFFREYKSFFNGDKDFNNTADSFSEMFAGKCSAVPQCLSVGKWKLHVKFKDYEMNNDMNKYFGDYTKNDVMVYGASEDMFFQWKIEYEVS